jgi:hypothetical protein
MLEKHKRLQVAILQRTANVECMGAATYCHSFIRQVRLFSGRCCVPSVYHTPSHQRPVNQGAGDHLGSCLSRLQPWWHPRSGFNHYRKDAYDSAHSAPSFVPRGPQILVVCCDKRNICCSAYLPRPPPHNRLGRFRVYYR